MRDDDSMAVVGMAGCFPGAKNVAEFWENIKTARVAPLRSLESSWGVDCSRYFADGPQSDGKIYMDQGYCLGDSSFAQNDMLGRQTRIGSLIVKEALASVSPGSSGPTARETGIVAATSWSDQSYFQGDAKLVLDNLGLGSKLELPEVMHAPETQLEMLANSDSVAGPRVAVDTACASSIYAVDFARGLLEQGSVKRIVVLGLNLNLPLFLYAGLCKVQAISPMGQILPFAKNASGMVPGECAAAVVLERTEIAWRAGRNIIGVVKSTGLSSDGADRSIFAPSFSGQSLAYERAYKNIDPGSVVYLEAHGTGTPVGDATELASLDKFFSPHLTCGQKIPLGSVKSLIGHTLAAAGLASIIKGLMIIKKNVIPPHIQTGDVNPRLKETCLFLPHEQTKILQKHGGPVRIGISSFGFGGANSHLIVESDARSENRVTSFNKVGSRKAPLMEPIAIVDMEYVLASSAGSGHFGDAVSQGKGGPGSPSAQRFGFSDDDDLARLGKGFFFNSKVTIEGKGMRMGPNFLKRHDALQLMLTDCVQRIFRRNEAHLDRDTNGVVISSNMGGAMSLALSRKYFAEFSSTNKNWPDSKKNLSPLRLPLTIDAVTSGLPTMSSGFPAFHFDLKGFHQTLSGRAGTFWTSLFLAPFWLGNRCSSLFLGAARLLKGPVDVKLAGSLDKKNRLPVGEGIGVCLLKTLKAARENKDKVYGTIDAIIHSHEYTNRREACAIRGLSYEQLVSWETCQLDGEVDAKGNTPQQQNGFLLEATGVETLASAFLGPRGQKAIEVLAGDKSVAVLFLTVGELWKMEPAKPELEIESRFFSYSSISTRPIARDELPKNENAPPPPDAFTHWLDTTSSAVLSYLTSQKQLVELYARGADEGEKSIPCQTIDVSNLRNDQQNVVITNCCGELKGERLTAQLVVDETHPYFFDHQLDHVPGILLFEGAYQLSQIAIDLWTSSEGGSFKSVSAIDIQFAHFAEKEAPIVLELDCCSPSKERLRVRFLQQEKTIARAVVELSMLEKCAMEQPEDRDRDQRVEDKGLLHKRRPDNVLVSLISKSSQNDFVCDALMPEEGHLFSDGDRKHVSPLYLLETGRQLMMLAAHTVMGIPKGLPMTLVSMGVNLEAKIPREVPLKLQCVNPSPKRIDNIVISDIEVRAITPVGVQGQIRIKTQVVDPHTYEHQRWGK